MVKSAKLWREISRHYAELEEVEAGPGSQDSIRVSPDDMCISHTGSPSTIPKDSLGQQDVPPRSAFYHGGFQHKHWVLVLCSAMIMCEWMDRSVLSISLQSMKDEFELSDTQMGLVASSSQWVVPITSVLAGRLADLVPKHRVLGLGIFGWGVCTIATGFAQSFTSIILCRLLAGLSNSAGYPVAVSLLAEWFEATEMTTAMGYFNAGLSFGGLLGLAVGGLLITQLSWRWAFWGIGTPQLVLAFLLVATVKSKPRREQVQRWSHDIKRLIRLPSLRLLVLGAFVSGIMTGNTRFISAVAERQYSVSAQTVGSVMGVSLGLTGIFASWCGGHLIDRCMRRTGEQRVLLWGAVVADTMHLLMASTAFLMPLFGLFVTFLALSIVTSGLGQGVDTAVQMLGRGCRATTQSTLEFFWAVGMGVGPFLTGMCSDALQRASCNEGCALSHAVLLVAGCGLVMRALIYILAGQFLVNDVSAVERFHASVSTNVKSAAGTDSIENPKATHLANEHSRGDGASLPTPTSSTGPMAATVGCRLEL